MSLFRAIVTLGALLDCVLSAIGAIEILGNELPQVLASIALAIMITGILAGTRYFFSATDSSRFFARGLWGVALVFDYYTSYHGLREWVVGSSVGAEQVFILSGLCVLLVSSPMLLSLAVSKRHS